MSRPYFETQVVKVKRNYTKKCVGEINIRGNRIPIYEENNWILFYGEKEKPKPKGNWVNGENLDEIKFPCFCRFLYEGRRYLGILTHSGVGTHPYRLSRIDMQDNANVYRQGNSLEELIKSCDIKILKGKIIIYENI